MRMPRAGRLPRRQRLATRGGVLEYVVSVAPGPSFVLFNGAGVTLEGWRPLYPAIERLGTVFAWNRFGLGASDGPRQPPTGAAVVASVRELLAYAGVAPPHVLVGHSLGGLHANLFARLHPRETAAVVLLEATHPHDRQQLQAYRGRLAGVLAKLLAVPQAWLRGNLDAEIDALAPSVAQLDAAGPFPDVPLWVVTGMQDPPRWMLPPDALRLRREHQRELAQMSPRGEQVLALRSGHFPQRSEPALVLDVLARAAAACQRQPVTPL